MQTGVPPSQLMPQPPQLSAVLKATQAPLHRLKPALHWTAHALFTQAGVALATLVVHTVPPSPAHPPQLSGSLVVSLQLPLQATIVPGQLALHAKVDPVGAHSGVAPLHVVPQEPQLLGRSGSMQPPSHAI